MDISTSNSFLKLVQIMDELREKCPWDKKQTIHTLRPLTLEETYELADAITNDNWENLQEELGDVLLHIIFYSKIATEQNKFTLQQVIDSLCEKLITRHPHIYANTEVNNEEDVKRNWQDIKMKTTNKQSILSGVPNALPAIIKATTIQEKAKQVGFEWDNATDVWNKVNEELKELQEAIASNNGTHIEEEFGDVLFSLINYARFIKVDAEGALEKTNKKFIYRFTQMEIIAKEQHKTLNEMSLQQMDELWNEVKKQTKIIEQ